MDKRTKVAAVEIQQKIRDILFDEWDPIGINDIAPRDEYDGYIVKIYRHLVDGADVESLMKLLHRLEVSAMESPTSDEHRRKVAELLLNVDFVIARAS